MAPRGTCTTIKASARPASASSGSTDALAQRGGQGVRTAPVWVKSRVGVPNGALVSSRNREPSAAERLLGLLLDRRPPQRRNLRARNRPVCHGFPDFSLLPNLSKSLLRSEETLVHDGSAKHLTLSEVTDLSQPAVFDFSERIELGKNLVAIADEFDSV